MNSTVQAGFEQRNVFNALKVHNVMYHDEVYPLLRHILATRNTPCHLLDIGCGDGSDIYPVLAESSIAEYVGVDSSGEAIVDAEKNFAELSCTVHLIHGDYQEALRIPPASLDIVWMGLFLHHLEHDQKSEFLLKARSLLKADGLLVAHDPLLAENEDRVAYIARLENHGQKNWSFLSKEERAIASQHWLERGCQERFSTLHELGVVNGFKDVTLNWSDPEEFYGLVIFSGA
jgi:cyclopropane fatty-acyl-phospholipid synthase-like methyltransferase